MEIKEEKVDLETYTDEDMKYEDNLAKDRIGQILQDNQKEMQSYVPKVREGHTVRYRYLEGHSEETRSLFLRGDSSVVDQNRQCVPCLISSFPHG